MSTVQENRFANQVDMIWDVWLNNFKSVQNFQDNFQQKALQVLSYQKELADLSVKAFSTIEEESKKVSQNWNEKIQNNVKQMTNDDDEQASKWLNNIQDVTESFQSLMWKPSRAVLDVFIESQNQLDTIMKKSLATHKKERTEYFKKMEELIEQVKTTQKEILNPSKA